jgi:hypothetical protein
MPRYGRWTRTTTACFVSRRNRWVICFRRAGWPVTASGLPVADLISVRGGAAACSASRRPAAETPGDLEFTDRTATAPGARKVFGALDALAEGAGRCGFLRELVAVRPNRSSSFGRSVMSLIRDDRLKKDNDLLLSGGCGVEFAAHLRESLVDVPLECPEVRPKVNEVLSERVEACHCGLPELAKIVAKSADVAVCGSCKYPSGRGVLVASLYSPGQVAYLVLKCSDACFEISRIHEQERSGVLRQQASSLLMAAFDIGRLAGSNCAAMCFSACRRI